MKETVLSGEHQDRLRQLRQGYVNIDAVDQILSKDPRNIVVVDMGFGEIDIDKEASKAIKNGLGRIFGMLKKDGLLEEARQQLPFEKTVYERDKTL